MQMFHRSHWMHQALLTPASANITAGSPVPASVFVMMCLAICVCVCALCNACTMCMCPEVLAHVVASRKQERCRQTFNTRSNQTFHYCFGSYVHNSKILFVENLKNIISLFFLRFYLMVGWVKNAKLLDHELLLIALFNFFDKQLKNKYFSIFALTAILTLRFW